MGFIPVLLHLPTILGNMKMCKQDIAAWQPDCVILVDYPGFNLKIAEYVKSKTNIPVYYYISPKIWAWKEYRIKNIKRDVDELFSILPFEVDFFEKKHHYPIHYVGNPTADEVRAFLAEGGRPKVEGEYAKPLIALLAGSRKQEIKDNLPSMLQVASQYADNYDVVVAGAPAIDRDYYEPFLQGYDVRVVYGQTYDLLSRAHAALVTSGTATLETALFNVPQVVCYAMRMPKLFGFLRKLLLKVPFVSLVNLVAHREVVPELVADTFTIDRLQKELQQILEGPERQAMLDGYAEVKRLLGDEKAPDNAAKMIYSLLNKRTS